MITNSPWEQKVISSLPNHSFIAWNDREAFFKYPKYNHVYDKLIFTKQHTLINVFDLEQNQTPTIYPVIVQPRVSPVINGKTYIANCYNDIEDFNKYVALELSLKRHFLSMLTVINGKIEDYISFRCYKNFLQDITTFEATYPPTIEFIYIMNKVEEVLKGFTGIVSVVFYDQNIVEFKLCPVISLYNVSGNIIQNFLEFTKTGKLKKSNFENTYSVNFYTQYDAYVSIKQITPIPSPDIRSVDYKFKIGERLSRHTHNSTSYNYMTLNGYNKHILDNHGNFLKKNILTFERV